MKQFDINSLFVGIDATLILVYILHMGQTTVLLQGSNFSIFFLTDSHPNGHNYIRNNHLGGQNH